MNKVMTFAMATAICLFLQNTQAIAWHHDKHHHHTQTFGNNILASFYGPGFNGRKTASGEIFNASGLTAAHRSLPFGTILEVSNPNNGRRCRVKVNDRGPYSSKYSLDISQGTARILGFTSGLLKMIVVR